MAPWDMGMGMDMDGNGPWARVEIAVWRRRVPRARRRLTFAGRFRSRLDIHLRDEQHEQAVGDL